MSTPRSQLAATIEDSLEVRYHSGAVGTVAPPFQTPWMVFPWCSLAHIDRGRVTVEIVGEPLLEWRGGQALCLPPNLRHRLTLASRDVVGCRWAYADFRMLGSVEVATALPLPRLVDAGAAAEIGLACSDLAALAQRPAPGVREFAARKASLFRLLAAWLDASDAGGRELELLAIHQRLAPALAHIEGNLRARAWSVHQLARLCVMSPSRFHAVFRQALGASPARYAQARRLAQAQRLLFTGDRSIAEIAESCGYSDAFHFSRAFKGAFGRSPTAFRKGDHAPGAETDR